MGNMFRCVLASGGALILTVTCDSTFAGQTITCTDGTTTLNQICPSTSPYTVEFRIPNGGTWTISSGTDSTSVEIPDAIELHYIPNGSTFTPTDDIQAWLHCASIFNKSYTTITQVLSDASTLQALISSTNAVDYMARSTTWANDVTADSSAMTYIGLNNYCANKLLANSTWLNAIGNSTYFENVLNVKVPTMTSDTTPSGVVSCSSIYNPSTHTWDAWKAFDSNDSTRWIAAADGNSQYIQYQFISAVRVSKYSFTLNNLSNAQAHYDYIYFKASNDGTTWVILDTIAVSDLTNATVNRAVNNSNEYTRYRIEYGKASSGDDGYVSIQFYGRAE